MLWIMDTFAPAGFAQVGAMCLVCTGAMCSGLGLRLGCDEVWLELGSYLAIENLNEVTSIYLTVN